MTVKKKTKKTSQKQIEANRRNTQRSTGPKTQRGKNMSSINATKYEFLSREFTNSSAMSEEEKKEFKKYKDDIIAHYNPVGPIEIGLLHRYAVNQYRLSRIIRAENGELERSRQITQGKFYGDNIFPYFDDGEKVQASPCDSWEEVPSFKLERLSDLAAKIAKDIESTGKVLSSMISELSQSLAVVKVADDVHNKNVRAINKMMKQTVMNQTSSWESWDSEIEKLEICVPEKIREQMVAMLKGIKDTFEANATVRRVEEVPAFRSQLLRAAVPETNRLLPLMRYEARLENGGYRALHEFLRLQALRLGKRAYVPIAVDVLDSDEKK